MKKVKEYLDRNLIRDGKSTCYQKDNGHYSVQGSWYYPKEWKQNKIQISFDSSPDHIQITINNETIIVGNMSVDNKWSHYHQLQTYQQIERGLPDDFGYYARSTEDEIIRYIDTFLQKIIENKVKKRINKIDSLLDESR